MSAPSGTVAELARAWIVEHDNWAGREEIGDKLALDRALIETPIKTREDVIGLLEVAIYDFRIAREDAAGKFKFGDNGEEIWWTAINAAHRLLTA